MDTIHLLVSEQNRRLLEKRLESPQSRHLADPSFRPVPYLTIGARRARAVVGALIRAGRVVRQRRTGGASAEPR